MYNLFPKSGFWSIVFLSYQIVRVYFCYSATEDHFKDKQDLSHVWVCRSFRFSVFLRIVSSTEIRTTNLEYTVTRYIVGDVAIVRIERFKGHNQNIEIPIGLTEKSIDFLHLLE